MNLAILACASLLQKGPPTTPISAPKQPSFSYVDKPVGSGRPVTDGDLVTIQFVVRGVKNQEMADSKKRGIAYSFKVGVPGNETMLDMVVKGMRPGATRTATISARIAYGPTGAPGIVPADEVLKVTVVLLRRGT